MEHAQVNDSRMNSTGITAWVHGGIYRLFCWHENNTGVKTLALNIAAPNRLLFGCNPKSR
jgi:hypothetical protein